MNKCILIGRLCSDPDVRQTQSGTSVASYRIAVDRAVKKEGQPDADFLTCIAWGKGAEFAQKYLAKGTKIAIEGRIQTRSYEKDGEKRNVTEIIVERHEFCESRKAAASADEHDGLSRLAAAGGGVVKFTEESDIDELPF